MRLALFFAAAALGVSFAIFFVLNNNATAEAQARMQAQQAAQTPVPTATPTPTPAYGQKITGVPKDTKQMYFSFDGKYCAFADSTGLVVKDAGTDTTVKTITDAGICWAQFLDERDTLLYLALQGTGIAVRTYDIGSDTVTGQLSITVPANAKVKGAAFSCARNYLCVNVESGTGNTTDEVYTADIMKRTGRLTLQGSIDNLVLADRTKTVYYTNADSLLCCQDTVLKDAKEGVLLGRDAKDNVYFQTAADKGTVYVIAGQKRTTSLELSDVADIVQFYSSPGSVYAVYDGYLVNLAGDVTRQIAFDKGMDFMGIGGANIYLRNKDGDVLGYDKIG